MKRTSLHSLHQTRNLLGAGIAALAIIALAGCPAGPNLPGGPGIGGGGSGKVDPNTCGNYAVSDAGRKLKAFLEATVELEASVMNTENYLRDTCAMMGRELGMPPGELTGDTKSTCVKVSNALKEHLTVGISAGAQLDVQYTPAVCRINVEAAASAAAKCEAKAEADISVRCEGSCTGTCSGACNGNCEGSAGTGGSGGECNGRCEGTCEGSCSGGCEGNADVEASASCKAKAEVSASVEAECTEPEVTVNYDAGIVVDVSKVEAAVKAIKVGVPRILFIQAKITGPVGAAFATWSRTATELSKSAGDLSRSFGDQALCISGQIAAAFGMLANIQASVDVQIEVSASVSASAGGGASGGT